MIELVTDSAGKVRVGAEIWEARSDTGEIPSGTEVLIVSRANMKLNVKPWDGATN